MALKAEVILFWVRARHTEYTFDPVILGLGLGGTKGFRTEINVIGSMWGSC